MKFVRSLAIGLSFSLMLSGCSLLLSNEAEEQAEKPKSPPPLPKVSWNFEEIMMQPPGKFAGDKYNYIEVRKELDKFPKGLSKEQYFEKLIQMYGENYKPAYVQLKNFDPSINIQIPKPDETIKLPDGKIPQQLNVEIVLDSSGSMNELIDGMTKMVVAKQAIQNFLASLPENANVSLRVYGHKGSSSKKDKALSCSSNELVYPLGPYNKEQFSKALNQFKPSGWTPLASAIEAAKNDLQGITDPNAKNIVYIVSDGIETCGGDPVKAAESLKHLQIQPVVNIIGFDVDNAGQAQLKKVAEAAGGTYHTANSQTELEKYLEKENERLYYEWLRWGNDQYSAIMSLWSKKYDKLSSLYYDNYGISTLKDQERRRILEAIDYLYKKDKINKDLKEELESLAWDRESLIGKNAGNLYDQLYNRLSENTDKAKEETNRLQEEKMKKYGG